MKKSSPSDFDLQYKTFELFCQVRKWSVWRFAPNRKNQKQCIGYAFDEEGNELIFLISENGNYYKFVDVKKWEPYEYAMKKEEMSDVCGETEYLSR